MESPDAQETQAETAAPEAPAPETEAPQEAMPEEVLPEEPPDTPAPKARANGRPKGSKTVNRRPKATADPEGAAEEGAASAAAPSAVVETPPDIGGAASRSDIFEITRQRQTAQFERRQAFYQSFLPVR